MELNNIHDPEELLVYADYLLDENNEKLARVFRWIANTNRSSLLVKEGTYYVTSVGRTHKTIPRYIYKYMKKYSFDKLEEFLTELAEAMEKAKEYIDGF